MGRLSSTALRLGSAFALVLALFGIGLAVTLHALGKLADAEAHVAALEDAKHAGHAAASMVREQYIHQAHTLIEWNRSHVGHYEEVNRRAQAATERLTEVAGTDRERRRVRQTIGHRLLADARHDAVALHVRVLVRM